ncbi:unnamed protein product [Orchesella dallaii]|uniref:Odorant receptor n=1 Tax=Orchesella dallaii TaxID=48710 RepID=A0ABP1RY71_9HEXA
MATPLMLQAYELTDYFWRKTYYFKFYLHWDPNQEKFITETNRIHNVRWYLFGLFSQFCLFAMILYLLLYGLHQPELDTMLNWIVMQTFGVVNLSTLLTNLYLIKNHNGKYLFQYQNELHQFSKSVGLRNTAGPVIGKTGLKNIIESYNKELKQILTGGQSVDYIGVNLIGMVINFWVAAPMLVIVSAVFFHIKMPLDPFSLTVSSLFPFKEYEKLHESNVLVAVGVLVGILISNEVARALSLMLPVILICLYMTAKALRRIDELHQRNCNAGLRHYKILYILHNFGKEDTTYFLFLAMSVGYCVIGLSASATIMGFGKLSIAIYWFFPFVTVIGCFTMVIALPLATRCFHVSSAMKRKWLVGVDGKGTKFHRKSVMALRRVSFYFGAMREITDEFKLIYFSSVIDRFMDFLLLHNTTT